MLISDKESKCVLHDKILGCPLKNLELMQGVSYEYKLFRILGVNSSVVMTGKLATLDPVIIASSSVAPDEIIYDIPKSFSLTTNKNIESITGISVTESGSNKSYLANLEFNESNISLSLAEELPRNTGFTLSIQKIESTDGSYLSLPYSVSFKTSAGPEVQGVNIGSYKVSPSTSITLTFDIELDPNQEFSEYISISNENGQVSAAVSSRNNTVTIKPTNTIGACSSFTVTLKDGIKNKFGVSGNSSWSTKSRTLCQQVFSIGKSVLGRSITAYRFGSGSTKILFVGGMHGDEKSSVRTLDSFVENLEQNFPNIPADKTVVVIPNTNPDGYSASSRTNSNNIDLNRNYPTFDWTSGIYLPGNVFLETGGGSNALSEPESVALANYTTSIRPRVVLTIHAKGRAVFANDAGDSKTIADVYASKSGFASYSNGDSDIFFSYPTTGEYEDWIREELNLPALLVELATDSSNEFNRQKSALWSMLSL
jgi:protein MpaA